MNRWGLLSQQKDDALSWCTDLSFEAESYRNDVECILYMMMTLMMIVQILHLPLAAQAPGMDASFRCHFQGSNVTHICGLTWKATEVILPYLLKTVVPQLQEKQSRRTLPFTVARMMKQVLSFRQTWLICAGGLQALRDALTAWFPVADGKMLNAAACMFTNTKDHHFIIDRHPVHHQVCLPFCLSFQGHFKACAGMSEDPPSQSVGARTD